MRRIRYYFIYYLINKILCLILAYKIIFAIQLVMFSWPIFLSQIAGCPAAGTSHILVRSSSRSTTYSVFRQLDPAFRRAALPAFMPSIIYRVVTTVINSSIFSNKCAACGDEGIRTPDLRRARAALSQLSYIPVVSNPRVSGPFRART